MFSSPLAVSIRIKRGNVVPVHKKGDKQTINNYRPVSLLPICGEMFERILYGNMIKFFTENNLISPNQSGFILGDSCINHFDTTVLVCPFQVKISKKLSLSDFYEKFHTT